MRGYAGNGWIELKDEAFQEERKRGGVLGGRGGGGVDCLRLQKVKLTCILFDVAKAC